MLLPVSPWASPEAVGAYFERRMAPGLVQSGPSEIDRTGLCCTLGLVLRLLSDVRRFFCAAWRGQGRQLRLVWAVRAARTICLPYCAGRLCSPGAQGERDWSSSASSSGRVFASHWLWPFRIAGASPRLASRRGLRALLLSRDDTHEARSTPQNRRKPAAGPLRRISPQAPRSGDPIGDPGPRGGELACSRNH